MRLRFQRLGDIIVVKDRFFPKENREELARSLAERFGAKSVVLDMGIEGEFRRPRIRLLYGSSTETFHRENGVVYHLDLSKVMFSKGNVHERRRLISLVREDEVVVDMFAGIGYFSLQIAKHTRASRVVSCEKNPDAFAFLVENVMINGLEERVQPMKGDCREACPWRVGDRVIMGYLDAVKFLEHAVAALRGSGYLHVHGTGKTPRELLDEVEVRLEQLGCTYEVLGVRRVKSYAPKVYHYVVDLRVDPRSAASP